MPHTNKFILPAFMASLILASCSDNLGIRETSSEGNAPLTFTASIDQQDWYGKNKGTRSMVQKTDEVFLTDFVTEGGKRLNITSHELNGIDSRRSDMNQNDQTRAIVSQAIDTRKLSISQVGFTQGDGKNTYVKIMNMPAVTTDGIEWSCNEFFVNNKKYTAERVFGALFPYNEKYVIKDDDYKGSQAAYGSLAWLDQFRLEFELASDSAQLQEDLLYAKQIRTYTGDFDASDSPTPLTFRHAMTAVKVKLGSSGFVPCVIKEVRLINVHNTGTFHFFDEYDGSQTREMMINTSGYWEVGESTGNCVAVTDFDTQGEYNCYVTGDAATFMMIPQELPEDAKLELDIIFNNDFDENVVTITAPIGTHSKDGLPKFWNIGTTHEYIIDTNENADGYYMTIEGIDQKERARYVDANGGDASITLRSYQLSDSESGEYEPLTWTYIGWSLNPDGDYWEKESPDWLHMSLDNGDMLISGNTYAGNITGEHINILIDSMKAESGVKHSDILKSRPEKGIVTDGAYDLSRHKWGTGESCGTTTANCYVIDAPGHYTFPTIYGNAMVDGKANPQAFDRNENNMSSSAKVTSFVDYLDRQIISPLIQYNTKLKRAALVWEDVHGLVTDVKLTQRGDYVDFRINKNSIDQGNALIAVYDEQERLVWSWHIWVTDEDISAVVDTKSAQYKAMPVNLGWKSAGTANAVPGRDIYLLFAQGESNREFMTYQTVVGITQKSEYLNDEKQNHVGSSPYYQWGRKDPMVGAYNGKSIEVYTYGARSFYCESLTTWVVPEWLDIVNKSIVFAASATVGLVVTVATGGVGIAIGGGLAVATGGFAYAGMTKLSESCFTTTDKWGATIGYSIQNPTCDIKSAMTWTDCKNHAPYHDLWGIGQNTDNQRKKVVKTIYDPCPVGFHVPEGNAFDGIKTGFNNGLDNGKMYLPACGARIDYIHAQSMEGSFDIPLIDYGNACGYWTAAPCKVNANKNKKDNESYRSSEGAYALVAGKVNKDETAGGEIKGSYEAWGYNMRPVADF